MMNLMVGFILGALLGAAVFVSWPRGVHWSEIIMAYWGIS